MKAEKTLTGEELFDQDFVYGSEYGRMLGMAALLLDQTELYALLEEAERTNQRVNVRQSNPEMIAEPDLVELIPR